jgi:hypothetical protein
VAYRAAHASLRVTPRAGLDLSGRGEVYQYDPAEAETPLSDVESTGWRWSLEARYDARADLVLDAALRVERGPGAASRGFDLGVTYRQERLSIGAFGSALARPLEFRFAEAQVWAAGAHAEYQHSSGLAASLGASRYFEDRDRPDAAAFDWSQLRLDARITWTFGSEADRAGLPPARRAAGRSP